jgi:ATP-dependent DNA helicase RecG
VKLSDSIEKLPKVGPKTKIALNQLGIFSCQDLLFFLPFRYQDKTKITKLNEVEVGDEALIEVVVTKTQNIFAKKNMFVCDCLDASDNIITLRFFNLHSSQQR